MVTSTNTPLAARPRILLLGDVHGDPYWFGHACHVAQRLNCHTILQLGDFGYWEHAPPGGEFLDRCAEHLQETDRTCIWVDGNHENHTVLRETYGPGGFFHQIIDSGFWRIRERLSYAPRGHRWTWLNHTFLACGGAYSIDKRYRQEGMSWWPEETITEDEMRACIDGGPTDVLVSHDAPDGAPGVIPAEGTWDRQKDNWPESLENRKRLARIVKHTKPQLVVHGHYHHRNSTVMNMGSHRTRVEGFGRDGDPSALGVLFLDDLSVVGAYNQALSEGGTS